MAKSSQKKAGPRVRKSQDSAKTEVTSEEKQPKKGFLHRLASKLFGLTIFAPVKSALRFLGKGLRFLIPKYFINSWREVKLVTWPNRRETWRLTAAVFVFAIVFGVLVAGVDKGLDAIFKNLILKH